MVAMQFVMMMRQRRRKNRTMIKIPTSHQQTIVAAVVGVLLLLHQPFAAMALLPLRPLPLHHHGTSRRSSSIQRTHLSWSSSSCYYHHHHHHPYSAPSPPAPFQVAVSPQVMMSTISSDSKDDAAPLKETTNSTTATAAMMNRSSTTSISSASASAFNMSTALLCGGLAFDAYVEPAANSSRWERGSKGVAIAFCSPSFTRHLYKGLVEITVQQCTGLPADAVDVSAAERLLSGKGVDACLLVAVLEGQWKEDVSKLEKEMYHTGVLDLSGAAHVSRSSVCWSSVDEKAAKASEQRSGRPLPYHIPASWGKGAQAVWPATEQPFYLYVQDPANARLVFTVLDADRMFPETGTAIGSTYRKLKELIPQAGLQTKQLVQQLKDKVVDTIKKTGSIDALDDTTMFQLGLSSWQGELKLTSKPRTKDKKSQILAGAAAGAYLAGPAGAAAGAALASFYEGDVQGSITARIRYLPFPQDIKLERKTYRVLGGMPGIDWGTLYYKYAAQQRELKRQLPTDAANPPEYMAESSATQKAKDDDNGESNEPEIKATHDDNDVKDLLSSSDNNMLPSNDLEHCFFINHEKTGATCAVYRSLEKRVIVVSFRGTCAPVDLITDASLVQQAWMEGQDVEDQTIPKIHAGFRTSLNSIARRLKELVLATPAPEEDISDYDMYVTGHSLGAALSTLFTADIAQYGIDAGRGLPQTEESEPWWKAIANTFMGQNAIDGIAKKEPPRPKSLRMYNFGSPRVGNHAFAKLFDSLRDQGRIDEAYRIVSGEDVVARLPRTMNALIFGTVAYEHVGTTVLITQPETKSDGSGTTDQAPILWIEGESDDKLCPTRDGVMLSSPMAEGSLLNDLFNATQKPFFDDGNSGEKELSWTERLSSVAGKVTERVKQLKASDIASVVGIDRSFTDREVRMIQSILQGKALTHHLEDEYYAGMGRASGFLARVGEEIVELEKEVSST